MKDITLSFVLLLAIAVGFLFCSNKDSRERPIEIDWVNSRVVGRLAAHDVHVIVIDSCEYLVISGGVRESLTHKGNCKFCEERRRKEQASKMLAY